MTTTTTTTDVRKGGNDMKTDWKGYGDSRPTSDPAKNSKEAPSSRSLGGGSGGVDWTGLSDGRPSSEPGPNKKA